MAHHTDKQTASELHLTRKLLCLALSSILAFSPFNAAYAQPVPGGQNSPGMTHAGNSVPVVNINTPNAAGMSHNTYEQFNVNQQGLILNNSTTNAPTQLGGWIQGNPNLGAGPARVILNEVVSNNPSMLRGYIEVGGQRADVIIANPAGITIDGAGFINASGVTLTTGTPQFNTYGSIESYRVGGGRISINGQLDTQDADYTRIIARAVEINSGIWANDLTVAAGTGNFALDGSPIRLTLEDPSGQPVFAIDVAQLGGMYAGKIYLIGTEHGVGVRNAGHLGAAAGQVQITVDGRLVNSGQISSTDNNGNSRAGIQIATTGDINNLGTLYTTGNANINTQADLQNDSILAAQNNLQLTAQNITNQNNALIAAGMNADSTLNNTGSLTLNATGQITNQADLIAGNNLNIQARAIDNHNARIISSGNMALNTQSLQNDQGKLISESNLNLHVTGNHTHTQGSQIIANQNSTLQVDGILTNAGKITTGQTLQLSASQIDNQSTGDISSGDTQVSATGTIINRGLIDGVTTLIKANHIDNIGTGRIYGDHLALQASRIDNRDEASRAAVIAARQRMDIGVQTLHNQNNALIYSGADMLIGGILDANRTAQVSANFVQNDGATIEAVGSMLIDTAQLNNTNTNFTWTDTITDTRYGYQVIINGVAHDPADLLIYSERDGSTRGMPASYNDLFNLVRQDYKFVILNPSNGGTYTDVWIDTYTDTDHTPVTLTSSPGQILAGGHMQINGDLNNDKSRVQAGQTIVINGNVTTDDAAAPQYIQRTGSRMRLYRGRYNHGIGGHRTEYRQSWVGDIDYAVNNTQVSLAVATPQQYASINGSNTSIGNVNNTGPAIPSISLPNNALYQINPGANKNYLIETDPRFANYGTWISSDYMLGLLGLDPARTQKRLGDAFYEQHLIREQIGQLTGYRFLAGYSSDLEQYKALMNAGVEFAQTYNITLGVELTAEQMQQLTTDIVWLVSKEVTLADGTTQTVLVPQVYISGGSGMIAANGSLISGHDVVIASNSNTPITLNNSATIAAQQTLIVNAQNIHNTVGQLHGNDVQLRAEEDINNIGGIISADNRIIMQAGRDIHIASTLVDGSGYNREATLIGNTGLVYLSGNNIAQNMTPEQPDLESGNHGQIIISAGRDINSHAGVIINDGPSNTANNNADDEQGGNPDTASRTGETTLIAGRDINLSTLTTSHQQQVTRDARNWSHDGAVTEHGSIIQGTGNINLVAQNDLTIRASELESTQGAINGSANTINIEAGTASTSYDYSSYTQSSGFLSSSSTHRTGRGNNEQAISTNLNAEQINLQSTQDMNITGSSMVATGDINLVSSEGNITLDTAHNTSDNYQFERKRQSGLMSSGGIGFTIGTRQETTTQNGTTNTAQGSTVGSLEGNINILAQNGNYVQRGSDVLALQGDINVIAQDIAITEARETSTHQQTYEYKQSGLTLSLSTPVTGAIQLGQQMSDASKRTCNSRMQALAAGATALNIYNNFGGMTESLSQLGQGNILTDGKGNGLDSAGKGAFQISLSLGTSKARSQSEQTSDISAGSQMSAGRDINLIATGIEGQSNTGNILIQGSDINAANILTIIANNQIDVRAAANTNLETSSNKSSSGSIGITFGSQGWGITVAGSQGKGRGNGAENEWTYSHVNAGNTLIVQSAGDTNLIGGVLSGNRVIADIGGDLNIETLQDTSVSQSRQSNASASITIGPGMASGSFSSSKASANGSYISANEYAGIMAGDSGFDITVAGNTDLKGGIIASTQDAINHDRNQLTTGSITVSHLGNMSQYDAKGSSLSAGYDFNAMKPSGSSAGSSRDSGNDASITFAGISGGRITITNEEEQQRRTGQSTEEAIASINRNTVTGMGTGGVQRNWDSTQELVDQMQAETEITAAFGSNASQAIGTFAQNKIAGYQLAQGAADKAQETLNNPNASEQERQEAQETLNAAQQYMAQNQQTYDLWKEGGTLRVIAHMAAGGLAGDWNGALGAGASAVAAPAIDQMLAGSEHPLLNSIIGAGASAGLGGLVGGHSGMSAGFNVETNNRQLHENEISWIERNAAEFARQQGITNEQALTILTAQALYQVDLIWGLKLNGEGYQFNEAAQQFLSQAGNFAYRDNILGRYEAQPMFTASENQRNRPGLYAGDHLVDFYGRTILNGQFNLASTNEVVGYHLVQSTIDATDGVLAHNRNTYDNLEGWQKILTGPFMIADGVVATWDSVTSAFEQNNWAAADYITDKLGAAQEATAAYGSAMVSSNENALLSRIYGDDTASLSIMTAARDVLLPATEIYGTGVGARFIFNKATGTFVRVADSVTSLVTTRLDEAAFRRLLSHAGEHTPSGNAILEFRNLTNAEKGIVGDWYGRNTVEQYLPSGSRRIARDQGIGTTGIDDLYRVHNHPDVDYVVVEYKFVGDFDTPGSSRLGMTADGRQASESWILGSDRLPRAVGDQAVARDIELSLRSGRVETHVVTIRPDGSTALQVVDHLGRPKPVSSSTILGNMSNLTGAQP